jgi:capsular exopolysaccharide synthesis family protein
VPLPDKVVPKQLTTSSDLSPAAGLPDFLEAAPGKPVKDPRKDSLLEILWRQRRLVMWAAGISLLFGAIYVTVATPVFTSTSRLYVRRGRPSLLSESHAPPASDDDNFLTTQREVISSTPILSLALSLPGIADLRTFRGHGSPFDVLKKSLVVELGKKVDLLSVSFDSPYPEEADTIVAAVVKSYCLFETDQRHRAADDASTALNLDKSKWERELSEKSADLLAFRTAHGIVALGTASPSDDRLGALNDALVTAHREALSARIQYDQMARQLASNPRLAQRALDPGQAGVAGTSPEELASLRQELALAKARARELRRQYLPGHPALQLAMDRVDELTLEQAAQFKAQLASAQAKEADMAALLEREQRSAIQQNAETAECARLQADISRLQQLVDSVDSRTREIDLTSDDSAVSISVLEPAHTDLNSAKPKRLSSLVTALLAGLFAGAAAACVRDRYDRRLSCAQDVRTLLGVDVLGHLPAMSEALTATDRARQAYLAPGSAMAEACRSIRKSLLRVDHGSPPKTLLIVSPGPGDGRSTLASNLAISLTETGNRVLLLDADLRSPMQNAIFSLDKTRGLAAAIRGGEQVAENGHVAIQHSLVNRLDVLPAGPIVGDPARLLNESGFAELLEKLADTYDYVIVDSPSLGRGPDARILAAHCDACLLMLREGHHNQRGAEQALLSLDNVGANIVGVVLNRTTSYGGQERMIGSPRREPRILPDRMRATALQRS